MEHCKIDPDLITASKYIWWTISTIIIIMLLYLLIEDSTQWSSKVPLCWAKQQGDSCSFCGFTRGLSSSIQGNWSKAASFHPYSNVLLMLLLGNSLFFFISLFKKIF